MAAMIEFKNVQKKYGENIAVKNLDFSISEGELFVLVGPNGAGKSSTLKMLVGLLRITQGQIFIGGHDIEKKPVTAKSLMSFVPDVPHVYDKLTPRELLRFVGKLYELDPKLVEIKSDELLNFFTLSHVKNTFIEEFSHGMRQKAILASALLHDPKVLILDEPMVGLDPMSIKSFKNFLKKKKGEGMTIFFSTHTLSMAEELGDRIGIIHRGDLLGIGSMAELREKYQSKENLEDMFTKLIEQEELQSHSR